MKKKNKKLSKQLLKESATARKRSRKREARNKSVKNPSDLFYVTEPALFDSEEGTFTNYHTKRRVKIHLVPAPWSRVFMMAIIYAFAITLTKFAIFSVFGRPQLFSLSAPPPGVSEGEVGP